MDEFRPDSVMVTGGAGFIGSHVVRRMLAADSAVRVVVLDALTYAGNLETLADIAQARGPAGDDRFFFVHGDIRDSALIASLLSGAAVERDTGRAIPRPNAILHLAAESHVDRSIQGPADFVSTNVQGTLALLHAARDELRERPRDFRFVNVSTDEVYGSLGPEDPAFTETTPLAPNSPYSASKAGADCLVRAYVETYGVPCITTRCSNNYGPHQFPEKLIPLMVTNALRDKPLPVYGDGRNVRDWLYVEDHADAIALICRRGRIGGVYNIGGRSERANIDVVRTLLRIVGKSESLIRFVEDRLGHDRRYAIDARLIERELGWRPRVSFEQGLERTVRWYVDNPTWWQRVLDGQYRRTRSAYAPALNT